MAWKTLVGCLANRNNAVWCSTPEERANETRRAYELRQAEQRANSYKDTCATYGYEVGTPSSTNV